MPDDRLRHLLERTAALHDHLCPRQVLGVRMGMHAADLLGLDLPQTGKRLLSIVETDGCFADGVSVATGCWLGRRTLRCVDFGKVAATFVDTAVDRAIRIRPSPGARHLAPHYAPEARDRWHAYLDGYQVMPVADLLVAEDVHLLTPAEELVSHESRRTTCDRCGEEIFNGREIETLVGAVCRACAGQDYLIRNAMTGDGDEA
jgi:formylmethanofuran dehydrogenase subunit E